MGESFNNNPEVLEPEVIFPEKEIELDLSRAEKIEFSEEFVDLLIKVKIQMNKIKAKEPEKYNYFVSLLNEIRSKKCFPLWQK